MAGYAPHAVEDFDDPAFGDVLAAKLSAKHCSRAEEAASLTDRLHALADRLPGMTLQPALEQELAERVALLADLIAQIDAHIPT